MQGIHRFRGRSLYSVVFCSVAAMTLSHTAYAASFNSSFLVGKSSAQKWNSNVEITPGRYDFDLFINDKWIGKFTVDVQDGTKENLYVDYNDVETFGLKLDAFDLDAKQKAVNVNALLKGGSFTFDPNGFKIRLTIPQAFVSNTDSNWVSKERWDHGINGAYLNYNVNYSNYYYKENHTDNENLFASLNGGINLYGFHFIEVGSLNGDAVDSTSYTNTYRYVEKPLIDIDSVLRVGKQSSYSSYFDTNTYQGLSLRKDMRMLPDSYGQYMPVIRGVATEAAVVTISQDGRVVEVLNIPAGDYEIDDLMPTGSRSDLDVTLTYASGRNESYVVPYSTVPGMLRSGSSDYNINIGYLDYDYTDDLFAQGEYSRGLNNYLTGYVGTTQSKGYQSYLLGSAISVPNIGSFSFDVETAFADMTYLDTYQGQKYKLSYSKYFSTRTNLTLASYYYQTDEYLTLRDYYRIKDAVSESAINSRTKERYSFNVSQPFGDHWGRLYFDGYFTRRVNHDTFDKQYNLSYSTTYHQTSYTISATRSYSYADYTDVKTTDDRIALSVSIPLSSLGHNTRFASRVNFDGRDYASSDVSLSGSDGVDSYSVNAGHDRYSKSYASVYGSHRGSKAYLNGSYGESETQRQVSLGMSGSVVAYDGGVLATSQSGTNFVILEAPGVEGAMINNNASIETDAEGRALIASAAAYRKNTYRIQNQTGEGEISGNVKYIAPVKGSISKVTYQTDVRKNYVFAASDSQGAPLPFGSDVLNSDGEVAGYVLQGGRIAVRSEQYPEKLTVVYQKQGRPMTCVLTPSTTEKAVCL
ncbi:hypothetical protein VFA_002444 [Vibrio furnissii CIP 102972]|nr:hypothetical protein VFA_002444 [Vibrio furnissii CIP 102972]QDC94637.1 fimbrial biogenesis outer membrane usher protein [Vibrio furnissii]UON50077.1 fimbrial biogenesis outer membrane usher protein [Vibrio furnissii]SUQ32299.1 P pilus assembly protein, porin PapC [Vibrio furnissii]